MIAETGLIVQRGAVASGSYVCAPILGGDLGVVLLDGVLDGHADLPGHRFCATERGQEIGHERN
jgi:hypothetical protein